MASKSLGTLTLDLIAKTGMFEAGLDRAGRKMSETERKAHALGKSIGLSIGAVGTAVGAAVIAGAAAATAAVDKAIDQMDELYNASQKIGIPTEVLTGFKYAAELSGVSIDQLQTGLGKLIKFQQDAAQGGKESTRVFEAFGIAVKDSAGNLRSTQDLVKEFADVFKALPDGPEQAALALQLFGKSGLELIPLLNSGSDGIKQMTDRARELGLVFDNDAGAKADEFNDKLDELKGAATGLATQVAIELLPELIRLVDWFRENYTEGARLAETAKIIARAFEVAGNTFAIFSDHVQKLTAVFAFGAAQATAYYDAVKALGSLDFSGAADAGARARQNQDALISSLTYQSTAPVQSGTTSRGARGARGLGGSRSTSSSDYMPAARSLQTAMPKSVKTGGSKKDNSEEEALRAAEKAARDYQAAISDLNGVLDEQARLTGGELTEAAFKYKDAMVQIQQSEDELTRLGKLDAETSAAIAQARDQATEAYNKQVEAINNQKTPAQEMLADLEEELKLLGMTNLEREKAIALRHANADAASVEGIAISQAIDNLDQSRRIAEGMDVLRNATHNLFADIASGAKSAKDIFKDFLQSIIDGITNLIAQQLTQGLFGSMGSSGGGLFGGFFNSLFGGLFGNSSGGGMPSLGDFFGSANGNVFSGGKAMAFANGGVIGGPTMFPMSDGRTGLMGEAGPEAIMPLRRGPDGKLGVHVQGGGNSGRPITIINNIPPTTERRSGQQIAQRTSEKLRIATSRNS